MDKPDNGDMVYQSLFLYFQQILLEEGEERLRSTLAGFKVVNRDVPSLMTIAARVEHELLHES